MLLIFGLSVFFRTVSEGAFHCPRCGGDRAYRRRIGRRWFTVFFLPVVPLNRIGEVVECRSCRTRFGVSVLRMPTAKQLEAALPAAMRAAAGLVLRAGDPADERARRRAIEAVRGYGDGGYDDEAVDIDVQVSAAFLREEIARAGAQLTIEAKEWFLAQLVRIALADGPLGEGERQALHDVGDYLGMSRAHVLGVILTTEGAAR